MKPRLNSYIDIEKMPDDPVIPDRLGALFWHFIRQVKGPLIWLVFFNAACAAFNALMIYYVGSIIDALSGGGAPGEVLRQAAWVIGGFVLCGLILAPLTGIGAQYVHSIVVVPFFGNLIRRQSHWYVLRHSLSYFQNDFAGRIANKVQQMGPAIRDVMTQFIGSVMYVAVFILSTAGMLIATDWLLIVPMIAWVALYVGILWVFIPRVQKRSLRLSESQSHMVGRIVDSYTNIMTVKLFARRQYEDDFVLGSLHRHSGRILDKNIQIFLMTSTLSIANSVMIGLIFALSLWLWARGQISPGAVAMILPLVIQVHHQMHWIMWELTGIFEWIGTAQESMQTISKPHRVTDEGAAAPLDVRQGEIRFDHVAFHYGKRGGVIDDLNLIIPGGQKLGLVGHSGAGKSTIANLLLRFYDLESGCILIDGQDISRCTQDSLRANISMVTQDTSLLHRSIIDNIRYGRPLSSREEVIEAARKAQAHDFILTLEDEKGRKGYDAHVGERGVKLSGGQRQRIAIARIILKDAPILILDEATSALDSEVETYIQQQLATLMQGKTVIAIAHRLSTIARMDRLIVMDHGEIIEDGSHDDLVRKGGHYARLWSLQSGGFLPE
ncbi:MAG: ABC transporter ATP-binding protein [Micavibrio aeruginosavorus]|uniref:ABC transporter ATP-binding protein n=1 Tax=Micavibrio aeruginosavorus TaxID=349221 RepID=A0A7T5UHX8_9BACT|nr:MAG: ABC transporter ATP-binding protein [Micavibrio aeruginosavorus]